MKNIRQWPETLKHSAQSERPNMNIPDGATYQSPRNKNGVIYYKHGGGNIALLFNVTINEWVESQMLYWSSVKELCYKIKHP